MPTTPDSDIHNASMKREYESSQLNSRKATSSLLRYSRPKTQRNDHDSAATFCSNCLYLVRSSLEIRSVSASSTACTSPPGEPAFKAP